MIPVDQINIDITPEDRLNLEQILLRFKEPKTPEQTFYDMCFCICAPQTRFKYNKIVNQRLRDNDFYRKDISQDVLADMVKEVRFYNNKSKWLIFAKNRYNSVLDIISNKNYPDNQWRRMLLVRAILGLGFKTASHFLRNQGIIDLAIIDTHVLKFLDAPKPMSQQSYERIERYFGEVANKFSLSIAQLDALVWKQYSNTPWKEFTI